MQDFKLRYQLSFFYPGDKENTNMLTKLKKGFTSADLKLFAVIFMFIDHIGAIVIEGYLIQSGLMSTTAFNVSPGTSEFDLAMKLYSIDLPLRLIGRIAFPLFAFMIVQGFIHTHSRKDYLLRLSAFALISQIPFHMAVSLIGMDSRNVFFTLALGLVCIWGIDLARERAATSFRALPGSLLVILCCCVAAWYINSDYSQYGVLCIVAFYLFKEHPVRGGLIACAILTVINPYYEFTAFLCLFFIKMYNGEKGNLPLGKYFFYAFYPVHMLILYGTAMLILRM